MNKLCERCQKRPASNVRLEDGVPVEVYCYECLTEEEWGKLTFWKPDDNPHRDYLINA